MNEVETKFEIKTQKEFGKSTVYFFGVESTVQTDICPPKKNFEPSELGLQYGVEETDD